MIDATIKIAQHLIQQESISPHDGGLLEYIGKYLSDIGFETENINIGNVKNLYAKIGSGPYLCFAGHVDIVPPGTGWKHGSPYSGIVEGGFLYGRGANDMKTTIACAMIAFKELLTSSHLSLAILLTSDEEDVAEDGIKKIVPILIDRKENIKLFILGEPTAKKTAADVIKIGRRGSITAVAKIFGTQGHIAYPELADNPIPIALKIATELCEINFEAAHCNDEIKVFGKSALQITNLNAFNETTNMIPGMVELRFGTRFNLSQNEDSIKTKVESIFKKHTPNFEIAWRFNGNAFVCNDETLLKNVSKIITPILGQAPKFDARGATSDGRFLYKLAPVMEIGFQEDMAHKVDERVAISDIEKMLQIYLALFLQL